MRSNLVDAAAAAGSGAAPATRRALTSGAADSLALATPARPVEHGRRDRGLSERAERLRALRAERDSRSSAALARASARSREDRLGVEQRVVLEYLGLANAVAQRFQSSGVDPDELRQVAYLGLTKAVRRFDSSCGSGIAAFAVPTISGEIKRYLRDATWAVRPPRALQELSLELRARTPALAQQLGREPTIEELAVEVGRSPARVSEALACGRGRQALSLDAPVGPAEAAGEGEAVTLADALPDRDGRLEERADLSLTLAAVLRGLPVVERRAVHLRYFRDMTQTEIAAEIGVSQMQVSRLLRRALDALRRDLEARGIHEE